MRSLLVTELVAKNSPNNLTAPSIYFSWTSEKVLNLIPRHLQGSHAGEVFLITLAKFRTACTLGTCEDMQAPAGGRWKSLLTFFNVIRIDEEERLHILLTLEVPLSSESFCPRRKQVGSLNHSYCELSIHTTLREKLTFQGQDEVSF